MTENITENLYREPLQRTFQRTYSISKATPENATAPKITEAGAVKVLFRVKKIDKCFCEPVSLVTQGALENLKNLKLYMDTTNEL